MSTFVWSKQRARRHAYEQLHKAQAARFPFPIEGRIPNFVGAERAANMLRQSHIYTSARAVKVNPDAPQLPVRERILADGKILYMPSPRLRAGFLRIDPAVVPPKEYRRAASLSHCASYGEYVSLEELAQSFTNGHGIDLIVTGSTAVTTGGDRAGKGEGYADIEYALLRELGMPAVPVVTTVHEAQIIPDLAVTNHDVSVDYVITPQRMIETKTSRPKPHRIRWELLSEDDFKGMPVLQSLRALHWTQHTLPDVMNDNVHIVFVGINPGRHSATQGYHFAGPGNYFWRLLHEAGFTPKLYAPEQQHKLLDHGIGITNIVSRPTRGETDITWDELQQGAVTLYRRLQTIAPRVVVLLGKNVGRAFLGKSRFARLEWGSVATKDLPYCIVAPNPSRRSTLPYEQRLAVFQLAYRIAYER